ncbi:3-hydroxyacyl-CoA dehydrogenase type-2-like [Cylas formicarius]|uniref:3-hydroxyacyl-CoA dehydrogenase type-2-like n=1 Tax=Cylas formicarius TaxID=197179 RepID=UPI00295887E7|nr:3-hydroxyacyl-CoA dehydrogenase type-2-like [Cylas formicarius]
MIKDSVYWITGGASGPGKATAEKLLAEGAKVVVCDLQHPEEEDLVLNYGDNSIVLTIDITSEKEVLAALDVTKKKFGRLNGVINCDEMSLQRPAYDFAEDTPHNLEEFIKIVTVNLIGTFNVIRLALGLMADNKLNENGERGVIINTTSNIASEGKALCSAYAASKAGLSAITVPLARDLTGQGIRVVDIVLGPYDARKWEGPNFVSGSIRFDDFANAVKSIIEMPMFNAVSVKLDGSSTD